MTNHLSKTVLPLLLVSLLQAGGLTTPARAALQPTVLATPLKVEFSLSLDDGRPIRGDLLKYDAKSLRVRVGSAETDYQWSQLSWVSEYGVRVQLVDKTKASDWLDLAEVAVKNKLVHQVKSSVDAALKLDPSVKPRADAIVKAAAARTAVVKFQKATPEQHAAAVAKAKAVAAAVADKFHYEFSTLETPHFVIFTDWKSEHDYLTKLCEEAYTTVSTEFNIPVRENVFVGKLPVFMFASQGGFAQWAAEVDGFPKPVPAGLAGYFTAHDDGSGHMAMFRPTRDVSENDPKGQFAHTLTHEFTHAFLARYRTNGQVPRWLHEGIAEYISYKRYPRKVAYPYAKYMAGKPFAFDAMFDDKKMPGAELYPVMQTMVEALVKEDAKGFVRMFNDVKDGVDPEVAIKRQYKVTYKDFEQAWRKYALGLQTPYRLVNPDKK
jgi:hypothetical protein